MKTGDLREMTVEELETKLTDIKKELFSLRLKKSAGQLENPMKIRSLKRDVARINTLIREKELGLDDRRKSKQRK